MLGAREVSDAVADRLAELLPSEVSRLDAELGTATAGTVPGEDPVADLDAQPRLVTSTATPAEGVGFDHWPLVQVAAPRIVSTAVVDRGGPEGDLVRQRWSLRLGVWARGDGYERTAAVRDRLTLAVLELLLRHPAWRLERGTIAVVPDRLAGEVATVEEDGQGAMVSAARVSVEVDVDSWLTPARAEHGPATTVTTDTRAMPYRHPAL